VPIDPLDIGPYRVRGSTQLRLGTGDTRRAICCAASPSAAVGGELCTLQLLCTLHVQSSLVGAE
jgi:hypothetical protein